MHAIYTRVFTWIGGRANFAELTGGIIFDEEAHRTHPAPVPAVAEKRSSFAHGVQQGKTDTGKRGAGVSHAGRVET